MRLKNPWFWLLASLSLLADRLTKVWVLETFTTRGETRPIWPDVFHFTYELNRGAAFSLFQGAVWLRWLSLLVSVGLIALAVLGPKLRFWEQLGYGLVLGGAVGNGIDRFTPSGAVIDFLDFRLISFPVFNLADVSINLGIACLLIAALRMPPPPSNS